MLFSSSPFELISLIITFIISISLHEYAHAWASDKCGDPTPRIQGRLTPNPLVHIDLIGFLMIFLISFGRGRPVLINPAYYKNRLRDELFVALAGPATNILLATGGIFITQRYIAGTHLSVLSFGTDPIIAFRQLFSALNIALAVFNLLPLPPLDGYRIISYLVPGFDTLIHQYGRQISLIVIAILIIPNPIRDGALWIVTTVSQTLFSFMRAFRGIIFL